MPGREGPVNPDNFVTVDRLAIGRVLDLGSGDVHPHADVTIDADPAVDPDFVLDLDRADWQLPFKDGEFDTVTAIHLLEHLEFDLHLWAEMQRVADVRAIAIVPIGTRSDPDHVRVFEPGEAEARYGPVDLTDESTMGGVIDRVLVVDVDDRTLVEEADGG